MLLDREYRQALQLVARDCLIVCVQAERVSFVAGQPVSMFTISQLLENEHIDCYPVRYEGEKSFYHYFLTPAGQARLERDIHDREQIAMDKFCLQHGDLIVYDGKIERLRGRSRFNTYLDDHSFSGFPLDEDLTANNKSMIEHYNSAVDVYNTWRDELYYRAIDEEGCGAVIAAILFSETKEKNNATSE